MKLLRFFLTLYVVFGLSIYICSRTVIVSRVCSITNSNQSLCQRAGYVSSVLFSFSNVSRVENIFLTNGIAFPMDQWRHLADVHGLFIFLVISGGAALVLLGFLAGLYPAQSWKLVILTAFIPWLLTRMIGWEPLFIGFHHIFFPQGNFAFPGDSLLIRLYPDQFWQAEAAIVLILTLAIQLLVIGVVQLQAGNEHRSPALH